MVLWELIIAGALGGLARTGYAALRAAENKKRVNLWYFLISIFVGAFIGALIGTFFNSGNMVAALVGYIGSDLMDNILSGVMPKKLGM